MASSVCFIIYSGVFQIWPLLAIELILLSINAYRLYEIIALRRLVTHMTDESEADFSAAMAYGKKRVIQAGNVIFKKGDPVDSLYYLAEGRVEVEDQNVPWPRGIFSARWLSSTKVPRDRRRFGAWRIRLSTNSTRNALRDCNMKTPNSPWP